MVATISEIEAALGSVLGLAPGESLQDAVNQGVGRVLGLAPGETLRDVVNTAVNTAFAEKLSIGAGISVDLPKLELNVDNLTTVVPDAVLRGLAAKRCWERYPLGG